MGQSSSAISHQKQKSKQNSPQGSSGLIHMKGSPTVGFPKTSTTTSSSINNFETKIFSLVTEVTKSKDETIASKNYTIQLLESMLQLNRSNNVVVAPSSSLLFPPSCAACGATTTTTTTTTLGGSGGSGSGGGGSGGGGNVVVVANGTTITTTSDRLGGDNSGGE